MVPFTMPRIRRTGSPSRDSRSGRTMGTPPATAASKSRSTPAASAAANSSAPERASSSLLADTTGLPDLSASRMSSSAGWTVPMTSTTRSISGSVTTDAASAVRIDVGTAGPRSRVTSRTATRVTASRSPVRASMSSPSAAMSSRERRADRPAAEQPDPDGAAVHPAHVTAPHPPRRQPKRQAPAFAFRPGDARIRPVRSPAVEVGRVPAGRGRGRGRRGRRRRRCRAGGASATSGCRRRSGTARRVSGPQLPVPRPRWARSRWTTTSSVRSSSVQSRARHSASVVRWLADTWRSSRSDDRTTPTPPIPAVLLERAPAHRRCGSRAPGA